LLLWLLLLLLLQVVAVKGVSPNGSRILAKHIWTHLPPPCSHASSAAAGGAGGAGEAMEVDGLGSDAGLSAVVAAGPFCIADDLAYDPLHEMLQELKANSPHMLVSSRAAKAESCALLCPLHIFAQHMLAFHRLLQLLAADQQQC
jgi:hypothetical protein